MALERLLGPCEAGGGQAAKNPGAADKPQGAGGNKLAGDETTGAGRSGEAAGEAQGLTAGGAAGQSGGGCVPVKPYAKAGARLPFRGEETIAELAADVAVAAQAIGASSWSRPEGPTQQTSSRSRPRDWPQAVPGGEPVHQLLIGRGPHGAAARMIDLDRAAGRNPDPVVVGTVRTRGHDRHPVGFGPADTGFGHGGRGATAQGQGPPARGAVRPFAGPVLARSQWPARAFPAVTFGVLVANSVTLSRANAVTIATGPSISPGFSITVATIVIIDACPGCRVSFRGAAADSLGVGAAIARHRAWLGVGGARFQGCYRARTGPDHSGSGRGRGHALAGRGQSASFARIGLHAGAP